MQHQPEMYVDSDGSKYWCLNGKVHREDGPAVERSDGLKYWYLNDKLHRENGPAVEWPDGTKEWYLNGKEYSFEDYIAELERRGLKDSVVNTLFNIG
jgi:hypothetical protein